jgi:hypothetical protein
MCDSAHQLKQQFFLTPIFIRTHPMHRIIAIILLAAGLAGCDMLDLIMDGFKMTAAVQDDLEQVTGVKPQVGFNWQNGTLQVVTVTFPRVYDSKPLSALAEEVRAAVRKEFKQPPKTIMLSFSLSPSATGQTAQAE